MLDINTSDRTEQRKFGVVVGIAFIILAIIRWAFHGFHAEGFSYILTGIGVTLIVLGLVAPPLLKYPFIGWIKLALALNWIMTRVFLALAFYLIITPTRLVFLVRGEDTLNRRWDPDAETYWEDPEEQPEALDRYRKQF